MATQGWKFTVVVPSWTTHVIADESVVLYQVEVRVQPPGGDPKTRSILRRYSDFRRLYASLASRMPAQMKGRDVPSKKTFLRVNASIDQIEKRRHSLEEWLWSLLGNAEISRSRELAAFLELRAAAAEPHRGLVNGAESSEASERSFGAEPIGSSGADDVEQASTAGSEMNSAADALSSNGTREIGGILGGNGPTSQIRTGDGGRMGLHVEQRPMLRCLLADLQDRLEKAKVDMDDAVETAQCERRAREMMADRLAEAMSQLEAAGLTSTAESLSGGGAANENEEEKLRREAEALRDELAAERKASASLRRELQVVRQQAAPAAPTGHSLPCKDADAHEQMEALKRQMADREAELKSDMKVLAKEVKKLRKEAAQNAARADAAEARAATKVTEGAGSDGSPGGRGLDPEACKAVVEAMDSLRERMAACDLSRMVREAKDSKMTMIVMSADDILATSQNRIAALLAEAQLLRNPEASLNALERELNRAAADILTDVGLLRQELNNSPHILAQVDTSCPHPSGANGVEHSSSKLGAFVEQLSTR